MEGFIKRFVFLSILLMIIISVKSFASSTNFNSNNKIDKIKVVMDDDYPPYMFKDSSGKLCGILVDQWNLFEKKSEIKVEIHAVEWNKALKLVEKGEYDVVDSIFFSKERDKIYDFSKSYEKVDIPIFFNKRILGISTVETLQGFTVGVKKGGVYRELLEEKGITDFKEYDSYEDIIKAAKERKIVVFIMDKPLAQHYIYKMKIQDEFNYTKPLYTCELHRAVKKGNSELLSILEEGFSKISAKEYKEINKRWFGNPQINSKFMNYIMSILIIIISIIFLLIIWNLTLKRSVKQKTSELTKLVEELKISENKLRALFKAFPDIFFIINHDGIILDYKAESIDELYVPLDEFLGKSIRDIFPNELADIFMKSMDKLFESGEMQSLEYSLDSHRVAGIFEARLVQCDANRVIGIVRDITERKKTEASIYKMSMHDNLTGLNNRNYFENKLRTYQKENLSGFAVVICDLDGLKLVNDTLGHSVGDEYLCTVAAILKSYFRKQDVVARIGGDEFGMLMSNTSSQEIEKIKMEINKAIDKLNDDNRIIPISISMGYEIYKEEYKDLSEMFKIADNYMYRQKLHHHQSAKSEIVQVLMKMLEARDFITEGHGERLQELTSELAKEIGMSEYEIKDISLLAQFHDIGKVGISDTILFKPDKLNAEEAEEMKRHTEIGYRIAKSSPDLVHISDWIFKHHEWWNGNGYPLGLKGNEIPIQCRILSIVDAYDAMTNDRPYRKAMKEEYAVAEIKRCAGEQFDPVLVEKFIDIINNQ